MRGASARITADYHSVTSIRITIARQVARDVRLFKQTVDSRGFVEGLISGEPQRRREFKGDLAAKLAT